MGKDDDSEKDNGDNGELTSDDNDERGTQISQEVKDYILKEHLSGTGAGEMISYLSKAKKNLMEKCNWHRLLFRMPFETKWMRGGERVRIQKQVELSSIDGFLEDCNGGRGAQRNPVVLKKSIDLDTLEVLTNRLDVFRKVCLEPIRSNE